jgi:hypothetical protein
LGWYTAVEEQSRNARALRQWNITALTPVLASMSLSQ